MSELINAINKGNNDEVRERLDQGADVNMREEDGASALHRAALYGPDPRSVAKIVARVWL
jgi:ankyrin repeat protein